MDRKSFIFYGSYYEAVQKQDPMTRLKFYEAVMEYALNGNIRDLSEDSIAEGFFQMAQPLLEASIRNYENGCKGGRPRKKEKQDKTKPEDSAEEKNDDAVPAAESECRGAELEQHGQHNNVRLSTEDYNMLVNSHGEKETKEAIEELDLYIETLSPEDKENYLEKNHAACMERWVYSAVKNRLNPKVRNFADPRGILSRPEEHTPEFYADLERRLVEN